ncbi:MAG: glycosyltransferase family 8 protein [Clostridiales bacterium]|nr:glycosyltransferase family 8 protein [Clostridiales bacterium]MCD7827428.1 glycosyltransferase family 8 protein [Clostridiales bacterium]
MNILVTLDENYLHPLTVMLKSMTISNPKGDFDIWVAHTSLTEENFREIYNSVDEARMRVHPVIVPEYSVKDPMMKKRLTLASYYRLYALDYLPSNVDRVLYLDPDTVVINNIGYLYNMDLGDKLIAAAGHTYGAVELFNKKRLNLEEGRRYVNSGVILMDLDKIRRMYTIDVICRFISEYKGSLLQGDQDILNVLFKGQILILDEKYYNLDEKTLCRFKRIIDINWVRRNTVIVHFNGKYKPWRSKYKGSLKCFFTEALSVSLKSAAVTA